ncbi:cell wall-active antibiotics response protein LiaF [Halobacillus dabanensis]|uniref:cell wall-active antibiotics response protein LiaF n=1 Tax=Halobacillus dabanensis TaxID=240302 RepID=UPI001428D206|nr:cell wall-active antibiotics response protein LiaF [Halobacillus dabanensis]
MSNVTFEREKRVVVMHRQFFHILWASLLVIIGGILLLSNLNIISLEMDWSWGNIYPFLLLFVGLKLWLNALVERGGNWIAGSFLTIFSGLLILDRFGIIPFTFSDVWQLWPLLFIYIGFGILFRKSRSKYKFENDSKSSPSNRPKSKHMMIGDHSFNEENWKVEPMNLWNGVGDYKFDFTRAFIPDLDTPIIVRGWVGDVKMLVPKHVPFRVDAKVKTGDIRVAGHKADGMNRSFQFETEDYSSATRRLTINIDLGVGSIRVEQV